MATDEGTSLGASALKLPQAAMLISTSMLERLALTVADIEAGEITSTDLLKSGLMPEAARVTGVWAGTRENPMLEVPEQITMIGAQSSKMSSAEAAPRPAAIGRRNLADTDFDSLVQELEETEDVSLTDVVGRLSPNLLLLFGADAPQPAGADEELDSSAHARPPAPGGGGAAVGNAQSFAALVKASVISLPATLIDIEGTGSRPFILLDTKDGAASGASKFVGLELTEAQSRALEVSTITPLEKSLLKKLKRAHHVKQRQSSQALMGPGGDELEAQRTADAEQAVRAAAEARARAEATERTAAAERAEEAARTEAARVAAAASSGGEDDDKSDDGRDAKPATQPPAAKPTGMAARGSGDGSDDGGSDDDDLWGDDDDDGDGDLDLDMSGIDPALLSMLGAQEQNNSVRLATTWVAPETAGLDNSLEATAYAQNRKEQGKGPSVGMVIANGMWKARAEVSDSEEEDENEE
ncbi:hypothetical protein KFE25_012382 [Diacronema lutheri]|uniref:Uncharacterized protein n=2 Tax=Diacronema lutheri TaxID=2081491 RepID=A0A8J5XQZ9_DIALT|nr:hypothetical protein KFE25_012382 [Diacronema lutheri]